MNEYEYRIPLFGPYYSNSRIVRIIRTNTGMVSPSCPSKKNSDGQQVEGHVVVHNLWGRVSCQTLRWWVVFCHTNNKGGGVRKGLIFVTKNVFFKMKASLMPAQVTKFICRVTAPTPSMATICSQMLLLTRPSQSRWTASWGTAWQNCLGQSKVNANWNYY